MTIIDIATILNSSILLCLSVAGIYEPIALSFIFLTIMAVQLTGAML